MKSNKKYYNLGAHLISMSTGTDYKCISVISEGPTRQEKKKKLDNQLINQLPELKMYLEMFH